MYLILLVNVGVVEILVLMSICMRLGGGLYTHRVVWGWVVVYAHIELHEVG